MTACEPSKVDRERLLFLYAMPPRRVNQVK